MLDERFACCFEQEQTSSFVDLVSSTLQFMNNTHYTLALHISRGKHIMHSVWTGPMLRCMKRCMSAVCLHFSPWIIAIWQERYSRRESRRTYLCNDMPTFWIQENPGEKISASRHDRNWLAVDILWDALGGWVSAVGKTRKRCSPKPYFCKFCAILRPAMLRGHFAIAKQEGERG